MPPITRGNLTVSLAACAADIDEVLDLRRLTFRTLRGIAGQEGDSFDAVSEHLLVRSAGRSIATLRLRLITPTTPSYTAQFFDLSNLPDTPMLEIGRFCLHPEAPDPDTLRIALAYLTRLVDDSGVSHLIGCSSLPGTELSAHARALGAFYSQFNVTTRTLVPESHDLLDIVPLGEQRDLPPFLRHYLNLGARLSTRAVVDRSLHTCLVLTLLRVVDIPPSRARALRELARSPR